MSLKGYNTLGVLCALAVKFTANGTSRETIPKKTPLPANFEPGIHENTGRNAIDENMLMFPQSGTYAVNNVAYHARFPRLWRIVGPARLP